MSEALKSLDGFEISYHPETNRIINIKIKDETIDKLIFPFKKFNLTALEYKPFTRFTIAKALDETASGELSELLNSTLKNRDTSVLL